MPKPTTSLTVYLMKEDLLLEEYLSPHKEYQSYDLKEDYDLEGTIFIGEEKSSKPGWLGFLQEGAAQAIPDCYNGSTRGLLLIRLQGFVFALTFGYGKSLLLDDVEITNFGLKTTLNGVNPERLRSIDMVSVMNLGLQTRMQTAQQGNKSVFGTEVVNDLLRTVTGKPLNNELGLTISGQDSLALRPKMDFKDLSKILAEILTVYQNENYKEHFGWIDNIQAVKSKQLVDELNDEMITALRDPNRWLEISMAPPEPIDWEAYTCCGFSARGEKGVELTTEGFIFSLADGKIVDLETLKRRQVYLEKVDSEEVEKLWKVYQCIVFETVLNSKRYILASGVWYQVDDTYALNVADYVRALPTSTFQPIDPKVGEHETPYNARLAASRPDYSLADRKNVRCEFAKSVIEPCDILTADGQMVHVKPGRRSSTLSHLFSQGRVAAEAFRRDKPFRKGVRRNLIAEAKIDKNVIPLDNLKPQNFEIVFLFIDDRPGEVVDMLPFFSQVNLMHSVEKIRLMGYRVSVKKVVRPAVAIAV